jgi:hypothetical protein
LATSMTTHTAHAGTGNCREAKGAIPRQYRQRCARGLTIEGFRAAQPGGWPPNRRSSASGSGGDYIISGRAGYTRLHEPHAKAYGWHLDGATRGLDAPDRWVSRAQGLPHHRALCSSLSGSHERGAGRARAAMILCTDGIPTLPPVNYWNIPAITVSRRQRLQSFAVGPHPW